MDQRNSALGAAGDGAGRFGTDPKGLILLVFGADDGGVGRPGRWSNRLRFYRVPLQCDQVARRQVSRGRRND